MQCCTGNKTSETDRSSRWLAMRLGHRFNALRCGANKLCNAAISVQEHGASSSGRPRYRAHRVASLSDIGQQ
ncbi:unnamed protein product [Arctia plantaginis]|uniref:Uncharacterized protein n=1 Tax=Arctia plantaginis TaxID=874455 RepID=A0A8S1ABB0_ARCPL|nr:unnamed protein product [Arctia plantaginis]CAB3242026.1 unnamed protein product [Arctia plantaginis]